MATPKTGRSRRSQRHQSEQASNRKQSTSRGGKSTANSVVNQLASPAQSSQIMTLSSHTERDLYSVSLDSSEEGGNPRDKGKEKATSTLRSGRAYRSPGDNLKSQAKAGPSTTRPKAAHDEKSTGPEKKGSPKKPKPKPRALQEHEKIQLLKICCRNGPRILRCPVSGLNAEVAFWTSVADDFAKEVISDWCDEPSKVKEYTTNICRNRRGQMKGAVLPRRRTLDTWIDRWVRFWKFRDLLVAMSKTVQSIQDVFGEEKVKRWFSQRVVDGELPEDLGMFIFAPQVWRRFRKHMSVIEDQKTSRCQSLPDDDDDSEWDDLDSWSEQDNNVGMGEEALQSIEEDEPPSASERAPSDFTEGEQERRDRSRRFEENMKPAPLEKTGKSVQEPQVNNGISARTPETSPALAQYPMEEEFVLLPQHRDSHGGNHPSYIRSCFELMGTPSASVPSIPEEDADLIPDLQTILLQGMAGPSEQPIPSPVQSPAPSPAPSPISPAEAEKLDRKAAKKERKERKKRAKEEKRRRREQDTMNDRASVSVSADVERHELDGEEHSPNHVREHTTLPDLRPTQSTQASHSPASTSEPRAPRRSAEFQKPEPATHQSENQFHRTSSPAVGGSGGMRGTPTPLRMFNEDQKRKHQRPLAPVRVPYRSSPLRKPSPEACRPTSKGEIAPGSFYGSKTTQATWAPEMSTAATGPLNQQSRAGILPESHWITYEEARSASHERGRDGMFKEQSFLESIEDTSTEQVDDDDDLPPIEELVVKSQRHTAAATMPPHSSNTTDRPESRSEVPSTSRNKKRGKSTGAASSRGQTQESAETVTPAKSRERRDHRRSLSKDMSLGDPFESPWKGPDESSAVITTPRGEGSGNKTPHSRKRKRNHSVAAQEPHVAYPVEDTVSDPFETPREKPRKSPAVTTTPQEECLGTGQRSGTRSVKKRKRGHSVAARDPHTTCSPGDDPFETPLRNPHKPPAAATSPQGNNILGNDTPRSNKRKRSKSVAARDSHTTYSPGGTIDDPFETPVTKPHQTSAATTTTHREDGPGRHDTPRSQKHSRRHSVAARDPHTPGSPGGTIDDPFETPGKGSHKAPALNTTPREDGPGNGPPRSKKRKRSKSVAAPDSSRATASVAPMATPSTGGRSISTHYTHPTPSYTADPDTSNNGSPFKQWKRPGTYHEDGRPWNPPTGPAAMQQPPTTNSPHGNSKFRHDIKGKGRMVAAATGTGTGDADGDEYGQLATTTSTTTTGGGSKHFSSSSSHGAPTSVQPTAPNSSSNNNSNFKMRNVAATPAPSQLSDPFVTPARQTGEISVVRASAAPSSGLFVRADSSRKARHQQKQQPWSSSRSTNSSNRKRSRNWNRNNRNGRGGGGGRGCGGGPQQHYQQQQQQGRQYRDGSRFQRDRTVDTMEFHCLTPDSKHDVLRKMQTRFREEQTRIREEHTQVLEKLDALTALW
ncbi:hypothetical protein F4778DRAFT_743273 [Xylariomycetidae sp. FL2044]|nr:hypothetical protein F4778DRAFT_743273 [Xylariomycetidae sp. FL2044]